MKHLIAIQFALAALALVARGQESSVPGLPDLKVGHWIEAKGALEGDIFVVSEVEVQEPGDEEELIGVATRVKGLDQRFELLGLRIDVDAQTKWTDMALDALEGRRVKVEGRWKGGKLSAKEVSARGEGRDRIVGRIDAISGSAPRLELSVMDFRLRLADDAKLDKPEALATAKLAPAREVSRPDSIGRIDADDYIPGSVRLSENLRLGALLDTKWTREVDRDLDADAPDAIDSPRAALRLQLLWMPRETTALLVSPRLEWSAYLDEGGDDDEGFDFDLVEAWVRQDDPWALGLQAQLGRLDFDDDREWIYKRYLDSVRLRWERGGWHAEAAGMTLLDGDSDSDSDLRDESTDSLWASVGWSDEDRSASLWVLDQRFTGVDPDPAGGEDPLDGEDWPFFIGARVLGEWIEDLDLWADAAVVRGWRGDADIEGFGFDVGATFEPDAIAPFYFTLGWAHGSGDDPATSDVDEGFRQTGWQRNNGKLGGVTSFRYYGEAIDPELSNLSIATVGVGARLGRKNSLDLVWHSYTQDRALDYLRDTSIDQDPDGASRDIGMGVDLIFGSKAFDGWDFELVYGRFLPGAAFGGVDDMWTASAQVRYRF
ncbi:MAG: alginate export family protein [Planctomycetia bacterium]